TGRYSYLLYFHTLKSCFLHTSPKYRSIPDFYLVGIKIVDLFRNYLFIPNIILCDRMIFVTTLV
ncbi:MAG: hypothetical protein E7244_13680, partial [Enterocloster citroniae]|nr:hypothetical protein [Enterocloster citroniae]